MLGPAAVVDYMLPWSTQSQIHHCYPANLTTSLAQPDGRCDGCQFAQQECLCGRLCASSYLGCAEGHGARRLFPRRFVSRFQLQVPQYGSDGPENRRRGSMLTVLTIVLKAVRLVLGTRCTGMILTICLPATAKSRPLAFLFDHMCDYPGIVSDRYAGINGSARRMHYGS